MELAKTATKYFRRLAVSAVLAAGVLASAYSGQAINRNTFSEGLDSQIECSYSDYRNFVMGAFDRRYDNHNMFHKDSLDDLLQTTHKIYGHLTVEITKWDYSGKEPKKEISYATMTSCGSAVAVGKDKDGLLLLTANHVVSNPELPSEYDSYGRPILQCRLKEVSYVLEQEDVFVPLVMAQFTGTQRMSIGPELEVILRNPELDAALIRTKREYSDSVKGYKICSLWGNSSELEPGDFLYFAGFPRNVTKQLVAGFVSSKGNPYTGSDDHLFVADASINQGNSGGPAYALRDGKPELVGIVRSKYPEGIGGIVRIDFIKEWLSGAGFNFWGDKDERR